MRKPTPQTEQAAPAVPESAIDRILAQRPKSPAEITFTFAGEEFVFTVPRGFGTLAKAQSEAKAFADRVLDGPILPTWEPYCEDLSEQSAGAIGLAIALCKAPELTHLDWLRLAHEWGAGFASIIATVSQVTSKVVGDTETAELEAAGNA